MRIIKKLFNLVVILLVSLFLSFGNEVELYANKNNKNSNSKPKSNNLTQKAKKQPSNHGKHKVFKCKKCRREVKTTLDTYKVSETYQKGFCSAGCKNAGDKKK